MIVVLHNIRSIYNVGSVFRTADAVGVEKIYLIGITPKPVDRFGKLRPQFMKVSLGAEESVKHEHVLKFDTLFRKLKRDGYKIFAIEQNKNSTPYYELPALRHRLRRGERTSNQNKKIALILGNEVRGLSPTILKRADKILEIPMHGKKESLNVAVAFGIIAYHIRYST